MDTKKQDNSIDIRNAQGVNDFAEQLRKYCQDHKLIISIKGKQYALVEGWQFAGTHLGLFPLVVNVENLCDYDNGVFKYRATVDLIRHDDGRVVGRGVSMCSNEENSKRSFDEYAVESMAQTRAVGKAFRIAIGWVVKRAGFEATPAEEMPQDDEGVTPAVEKLIQKCKTNEALDMAVRSQKHLWGDANFKKMVTEKRASL